VRILALPRARRSAAGTGATASRIQYQGRDGMDGGSSSRSARRMPRRVTGVESVAAKDADATSSESGGVVTDA
jgi:hypothetical protein